MSAHSEMVERVGLAALKGLLDRRGIKHELGACKSEDPEIWQEIVEETGRAAIEAMRADVLKVFASYLSPEYSVPQCVTSRQISKDMQALFDAAITEHEERS